MSGMRAVRRLRATFSGVMAVRPAASPTQMTAAGESSSIAAIARSAAFLNATGRQSLRSSKEQMMDGSEKTASAEAFDERPPKGSKQVMNTESIARLPTCLNLP